MMEYYYYNMIIDQNVLLGEVINSIEHDWIVYEILMQHKNMLHTQIY